MGYITKEYTISAPLERVFVALTSHVEVEQWSGSEAIMDTSPNGEFSLWGGSIHGINVQITKHRIEQKWKEEKWVSFSKVVFELKEYEEGTKLKLLHEDIPEDSLNDIDQGWDDYYLGPLKYHVER